MAGPVRLSPVCSFAFIRTSSHGLRTDWRRPFRFITSIRQHLSFRCYRCRLEAMASDHISARRPLSLFIPWCFWNVSRLCRVRQPLVLTAPRGTLVLVEAFDRVANVSGHPAASASMMTPQPMNPIAATWVIVIGSSKTK